jgi:guanosine-3',5'-bis(diphosphate) 3'-pyrophosphohydrolase
MPPQPDPTDTVGAEVLLRAVAFAAHRHRTQRRKDRAKTPYINHPIEVASVLANTGGVRDLTVLVAAVLHDTVEDTGTRPEELRAEFGRRVCSLVVALSDDKRLHKAVRKRLRIEHAPHLPRSAKLIKLADLTSNLTGLANSPPARWPLQRKQKYVDWAARVAAGCRGVNPALEAAFDQALRRARRVLAK